MKPKKLLTTLALVSVVLIVGCKKDNFVNTIGVCPVVESTSPINAATGIPLDKIITVTFNEKMNPLTITGESFTIEVMAKGAMTVTGAVTYTDSTASFTPSSVFAPNTTYTATVKSSVKDLNGNALQADYVWTFSTGATLAPTVISNEPLNNATGVALNAMVTATFSVPMDPLTLTSTTFTLTQGATLITGTVSYAGTIASFKPASNLSPGTIYTATITTGAKNVPGTALLNNYIWTFTTGTNVAPTVISTDPINLATGVALNKQITATFSEAMDPLTITTSTFTLKAGATTVLGNVSYSGTTATFTPTSNLLPSTIYTATITNGGKNVPGIALANNFVWTFTTLVIPAPTVISTDPINLTTDVPLNKVISANFSEAMSPLTITTLTFTLKNGATLVAGAVNYSGTTATFTPTSNLLSGTVYTATITTDAKNLAGIPLANNYIWTFTTGTIVAPTVISTDPINLASGVALDKHITATFSEAMDPLTITTLTFTLKKGATSVLGVVNYSGTTATFIPSANLLSDNVYTATITIASKNPAGIPLANDYVWTFSTVAHLGPLAPDLKSVARFGIISGVGVSNNAGPSEIHDLDVGIYPGARTSITGFMAVDGGPGLIFNGAFYASDDIAPPGVAAMLLAAKNDLVTAYDFAKGATSPAPQLAPADLGGKTLAPGIWTSASTMLLQNGNLTLDAQGDVNAVWIFQIGTAFTSIGSGPYPSASGGNVILAGGAQAKNIYWQVGSSAVIGDYTSFYGTIMAFSSITMNTGSTATGRMLARNAAVTLTSTNIINKP
jgi:hypothetical protein